MLKFKWETEFKETEIGEMPKEWEGRPLRDVVALPIKDGGTPSRKKNDIYFGGNIPWVTIKDIRRYIYDTEEHLTEEGLKHSSAKLWPKDTIIFSFGATIGEVGIAKVELATKQSICGIYIDKNKGNNQFYFYLLKTLREFFKDLASGSTFGEIRPPVFEKIFLPYPSPSEQSRIAKVLSWFDDLIENKKRQNEILEKTAMAIFKSWFIDFEPFSAKGGSATGEKDSEFVDSELGRIPKGWEMLKIQSLIKDIKKGDWGEEEQKNDFTEPVFCIRGTDIPNLSRKDFVPLPLRFIKSKSLLKNKLSAGDIVIEVSGGSIDQSTGRTLLVTELLISSYNRPLIASNFCKTLVIKNGIHSLFLYLYFKYFYETNLFYEYESGTTSIKNLDFKSFLNLNITIPSQPILQKFHSLVEPLFKKIILNQKQIMILRKIRDTLLPLLVFGKLRVEEI